MRLGSLDLEPLEGSDGVVEVESSHEVGERVVVDDGRVLIGTGDPVEVERPVGVVEAERLPHAGRFDEELGPDLDQEVDIAEDIHVPPDRIGDVGVQVVLGGARLELG
jgi:hypothetical protein